jgi:hypothetical protein
LSNCPSAVGNNYPGNSFPRGFASMIPAGRHQYSNSFLLEMKLLSSLVVAVVVGASHAVQALPEAKGLRAGNFIHLGKSNASSCSYTDTCTVSGNLGACVSVSAGCCSGTVKLRDLYSRT